MEREPGEERPEDAEVSDVDTDPAVLVPPPTWPKQSDKLARFEDQFRKALPVIRRLVARRIDPERLFALAATARARSPKLMACSDVSIIRCVIQGAQLGLDISGVGGKAYMVPYQNAHTRQLEAQFQIGYRGLIDLATRDHRVLSVRTREVYQAEDFEYFDGAVPVLRHRPSIGIDDPGPLVGAWAVAVLADKAGKPVDFKPEVMGAREIEAIRSRSKAKDNGPWVNDTAMMYRKTVVRRLCKTLPDDSEQWVSKALDIEDRAEAGESQDIDYELEALDLAEAPPSRTEQVKEEIKRGRGRPRKES